MSKPMKAKAKRPWQDIAQEVQDYRDATIDEVQPAIPNPPTNLPSNVIHIPRELLSQEEIQITQTVPEDLLFKLACGELTATSVTIAFLRRAGLAQKLVSLESYVILSLTNMPRQIVSQNFLPSEPLLELNVWTVISKRTGSLWDLYMACQSA